MSDLFERGQLNIGPGEQQFVAYLRALGQGLGLLQKGTPIKSPGPLAKAMSYLFLSRRERAAIAYCNRLHRDFGVFHPNQELPERLVKAHVKGHFRKVAGKRTWVRDHEDKRPSQRESTTETEEIGFHGTSAHILQKVFAEGLRSRFKTGKRHYTDPCLLSQRDGVYYADAPDKAVSIAQGAAEKWRGDCCVFIAYVKPGESVTDEDWAQYLVNNIGSFRCDGTATGIREAAHSNGHYEDIALALDQLPDETVVKWYEIATMKRQPGDNSYQKAYAAMEEQLDGQDTWALFGSSAFPGDRPQDIVGAITWPRTKGAWKKKLASIDRIAAVLDNAIQDPQGALKDAAEAGLQVHWNPLFQKALRRPHFALYATSTGALSDLISEPLRKAQDKGPAGEENRPKVKVRFSTSEIKEMGLKWVTAHPNGPGTEGVPILVKDLGDEYMVVGGAGGKMNFTRFSKQTGDQGEDVGKKERKKKEKPEISDEDYKELTDKAEAARTKAKEAKSQLLSRVRDIIGQTPDLTDEQRKKLEDKALAKAKELGVSKDGEHEFVQQAVKQHEQQRKAEAEKAAADALTEIEKAAGIEAVTGQEVTPEINQTDASGKTVRMPITKEQFGELKGLAAEAANAASYERSIKRALNTGGPEVAKALEMSYQPLSQDEQDQYFTDKHLQMEEVRLNNALVEATNGPGRGMARNIARGASHAGAGIAGAAVGTTILDTTTAQAVGLVASAQIIARYVAEKTGNPDKASKAMREFIGRESAAKAGAAVHASEKLRKQGLEMARDAIGQGLMEKAQAGARMLQYGNEGDRILGEAMGALETAAQVALNLEHLAQGKQIDVTIPGASSEAGTRKKAADLGLSNKDEAQFSVRKVSGGWEMKLTDAGVQALYNEQSLAEFEADAEVQDIKAHGQGDGWTDENGKPWAAGGQNEDIQLMPHQQANIRLWDRQKNLLVTDEAGAGKTATALCGITHLAEQGKIKKALVVVPKTVLQQFGTEITGDPKTGWSGFLDPKYHDQFQILDSDKMAKDKRQGAYGGDKLITVITHDQLRNDFDSIKAAGFDAMVVDEAHYFTTRGAKDEGGSMRAQKAREMDMPYKMLMTGTPVRNDLSELYSLADWLQPGCLGKRKEFMAKYGKLATSEGMFDEGLIRGLQQRLSGVVTGITLSTEKDENGKPVLELKPGKAGAEPVKCREQTVWADLTPEQQAAYKGAEDGYREKRKKGEKANPLTRDLEHKKTVNNVNVEDHPKVAQLQDIVSKHPDERLVVFAQNGYSQRTIIKGMGLQKGEYAVINGPVKAERRMEIAQALADPNSPVKYVICSDAANFGLNMQGASVLVNYDATDTYANHRQRIGREFRKGQKRDVSVYNLRSNTPYERKAQERIERKQKDQKLVENIGTIDDSGLYGIFAQQLGSA